MHDDSGSVVILTYKKYIPSKVPGDVAGWIQRILWNQSMAVALWLLHMDSDWQGHMWDRNLLASDSGIEPGNLRKMYFYRCQNDC